MPWELTGNSGTNGATNFLGTTDNQPLVIQTNGVERGQIAADGSLAIRGNVTVGAGGNAVLKVRHIDGKATGSDANDALFLNWNTRAPVVLGQATARSSLLVSGDLTVGAGNNGVLKVRHINGKAPGSDDNHPLFLNWDTRQPVVLGQATAPCDLQVNGDVLLTSDARLKTDITPIMGAMERLQKIRGVAFARPNSDVSSGALPIGRGIGVIAQEVEVVFPELVESYGNEGYKSVKYSGLTGVLIEALKEMKEENHALRQRVEALERTMRGVAN
jgi:hypothetical protein